MNLFDVIGPIMIGPSSSHTAGAVRLGNVARALLGETPKSAKITLYGSFAKTGKGHGTDKALLAGICGLQPDNEKIKDIFGNCPIEYTFEFADNDEYHPNTAVIVLYGESCNAKMRGASVGAGRIEVQEIDDMEVAFSGDFNTLIVFHTDAKGIIAGITTWLSNNGINIASMRVFRIGKDEKAIAVIETDHHIEKYSEIEKIQENSRVVYYEKSNA